MCCFECQLKRVPAPAARPPPPLSPSGSLPWLLLPATQDPHPLSTPTAGVFSDKGDNFQVLFLQSPEQMAPPEQGKMPSAASEANGASQPGWETRQCSFLLLLFFLFCVCFYSFFFLFSFFFFCSASSAFFCSSFSLPSSSSASTSSFSLSSSSLIVLFLHILLLFFLLLLLYFFTFCFFLFFFLFFLLPSSSASSAFFSSFFFLYFFLLFTFCFFIFLFSSFFFCFYIFSSSFLFVFCSLSSAAAFFVLLLLRQQDVKIQLLATSLLHLWISEGLSWHMVLGWIIVILFLSVGFGWLVLVFNCLLGNALSSFLQVLRREFPKFMYHNHTAAEC